MLNIKEIKFSIDNLTDGITILFILFYMKMIVVVNQFQFGRNASNFMFEGSDEYRLVRGLGAPPL